MYFRPFMIPCLLAFMLGLARSSNSYLNYAQIKYLCQEYGEVTKFYTHSLSNCFPVHWTKTRATKTRFWNKTSSNPEVVSQVHYRQNEDVTTELHYGLFLGAHFTNMD